MSYGLLGSTSSFLAFKGIEAVASDDDYNDIMFCQLAGPVPPQLSPAVRVLIQAFSLVLIRNFSLVLLSYSFIPCININLFHPPLISPSAESLNIVISIPFPLIICAIQYLFLFIITSRSVLFSYILFRTSPLLTALISRQCVFLCSFFSVSASQKPRISPPQSPRFISLNYNCPHLHCTDTSMPLHVSGKLNFP